MFNTYMLRAFAKKLFRAEPTAPAQRTPKLRLEVLEDRAVPAVLKWTGGTAGNATAWEVATNWTVIVADPGMPNPGANSNRAPGASDTALFTDASTREAVISVATTVGAIEIDAYSEKLKLNANLTISGVAKDGLTGYAGYLSTTTAAPTNYTIAGAGDFKLAAGTTFTWNRGTMAGGGAAGLGALVVSGGATLNIASATAPQMDARLAGRELRVEKVFNLAGERTNGVVNLTSGQLFTQYDPQNVNQQALITNDGRFNISGTATGILGGPTNFVNKAGAQLVLDLNSNLSSFVMLPNFRNEGDQNTVGVTVQRGILEMSGGGLSTGKWSVHNDSQLVFKNYTVNAPNAPAAAYSWGDGTNFVLGQYGHVRVSHGAEVTLTKKSAMDATGASVLVNDGYFHFEGGRILVEAGVTAPAKLSIGKGFIWSGGFLEGSGVLDITPGATANIHSVENPVLTPRFVGWALNNSGQLAFGKWEGSSPNVKAVQVYMGAGASIINKHANATITFLDNSGISAFVANPLPAQLGSIDVQLGKLVKLSGSSKSVIHAKTVLPQGGLLKLEADFEFKGTVEFRPNRKAFKFDGPGEFGDGGVTVAAGGSLSGDGEITTATFTNEGTVLPGEGGSAGALVFVGNFTQTATGALALELGGGANAVAGTHYDQVTVAEGGNQVTLAGTLQLGALPTLAPTVGTTFGIIDNQSSLNVIGTFNGLAEGATITVGGYTFTISYVGKLNPSDQYYNDVTLTVTAVPTVTLTGRIWNDTTANGIQDAGEVGVSGVQVQLLDVYGNVLMVAYTNSNGDYAFANVAAGQYRLRVIPPPNAVFVAPNAGPDDIDSDFDAYGYGDVITVPPGGYADLDAGLLLGPGGGIIVGGA